MSNRTNRGRNSQSNRNRNRNSYSQRSPIVSALRFNPDAYQATEEGCIAELQTICKLSEHIQTMIENGQSTQVSQWFTDVFKPQVSTLHNSLNKLVFMAHAKSESQQSSESGTGTGTGSSRSSVTSLPSARQLVQELKNDPRKLREYQDAISQAASASS